MYLETRLHIDNMSAVDKVERFLFQNYKKKSNMLCELECAYFEDIVSNIKKIKKSDYTQPILISEWWQIVFKANLI